LIYILCFQSGQTITRLHAAKDGDDDVRDELTWLQN